MGDSQDIAGWTEDFRTKVFPAELETIRARQREVERRRAKAAGEEPRQKDRTHDGQAPSTEHKLFGLAFSGGGIRSATFNLGIIQALSKKGLLQRFDYLSTVSGGGFIGSCLSSLLNAPEADSRWGKDFPLFLESGRQEPIALRHLREHSNYLITQGILSYFAIAAALLRGILIHFLVFLPFVIGVIALTHVAYGENLTGGWRSLVLPGDLSAAAQWFPGTLAALTLLLLAVFAFPLGAWLFGRGKEIEQRRRGLSIYAILVLLVVALGLVEAMPLLLGWYHEVDGSAGLFSLTSVSGVAAIIPRGDADDEKPGALAKLKQGLLLLLASALGPLLLVTAYVVLGRWIIFPDTSPGDHLTIMWAIYGGGAALLTYMLLFFDSNATSIHQFYRDQLSNAYLFQVDPSEPAATEPTDALKLEELNAPGTVAPYHLFNTALNVQGSTDPSLRGRGADFFLFSKHFCGSVRTGYCPTKKLTAAGEPITVGTAVAISGAAASPNMGTMSIRSISLLMVLLNVRLGYWLIHPERAEQGRGGLLRNIGVGLAQLVTEAASRPTGNGRYVNVSDGGHIENLAVYELLRRRCRVIVCGDGEADPDMSFNGLATVIRYAATDMGVHIDINLDELAKDDDGRSQANYAIGRIDYGDGEVGWLLYIKLSVGERELPYIENYRSDNPDFPHQSTGDQFFDEAQFEAYRALGFKVGLRTMAALDQLKQEAEDEELLDYSLPGAGSGESTTEAAGAEPMEGGLTRSFRPAADSKPPW